MAETLDKQQQADIDLITAEDEQNSHGLLTETLNVTLKMK